MMVRKNITKVLSRKGLFTRPALVVGTKNPNSRLLGKVVKQCKKAFSAKEAVQVRERTKKYVSILKSLGIDTVQTRLVFAPTKKGYKLNFVQPPLNQSAILENKLKYCNKAEAKDMFEKLITLLNKIQKHNEKTEEKIGFDPRLSNIVMINGELVLLDLYPSFVKNGSNIKIKEVVKEIRNPVLKGLLILTKQITRRQIQNELDLMYDMNVKKHRLLKTFTRKRPELAEEFYTISQI